MKSERLTLETSTKLAGLAEKYRDPRVAYVGSLPLKYAAKRNETLTDPTALYQISGHFNPERGDDDPKNLAITVHRAGDGFNRELLLDQLEQVAPDAWRVTSGDVRRQTPDSAPRPQHDLAEDHAQALIIDLENGLLPNQQQSVVR